MQYFLRVILKQREVVLIRFFQEHLHRLFYLFKNSCLKCHIPDLTFYKRQVIPAVLQAFNFEREDG